MSVTFTCSNPSDSQFCHHLSWPLRILEDHRNISNVGDMTWYLTHSRHQKTLITCHMVQPAVSQGSHSRPLKMKKKKHEINSAILSVLTPNYWLTFLTECPRNLRSYVYLKSIPTSLPLPLPPSHNPRGRGLDFKCQGWSSSGKNQNTKKSQGLPTKTPKKSLDQKLTPKKSHVRFPSLKIFKKGLKKGKKT